MKETKKFGAKGKSMLSMLIDGLQKSRSKWMHKYQNARTDEERMSALMNVNMCLDGIRFYKQIINNGIAA